MPAFQGGCAGASPNHMNKTPATLSDIQSDKRTGGWGVKDRLFVVAALSAITGLAQAADLCAVNPYKKSEAEQGKLAFDSKCAFCHQYNMTGREPGNFENESPNINVLTSSDVDFLDGAGGKVPPLVGKAFFAKHKDKSLAEFSAYVSSAANTFPAEKMKVPDTYFLLAAYILYRNCGKM